MKNVLKLSATAIILAGASLFSQSALACDPAQGTGQCSNIGGYSNVNSGGYRNSGGGYGGGVIDGYLGVAWTKDHKPFFYSAQYHTNYGFMKYHFEQSDAETLYECNKSSRRSPCEMAYSFVNGCIAIAKTDGAIYADGGVTCNEAKQKVMQRCQVYDGNPNACKIYKTKKS